MDFEFATATRIIFGSGSIRKVGRLAQELGNKALIATGRTEEQTTLITRLLAETGVDSIPFYIPGEPTVSLVMEGMDKARSAGCDLVIGFGGGSAIDSGKAIAVLSTNPGNPVDYLEVIGIGAPLVNPSLPFIAVPTTAGTGAEVTRNAVLGSPLHHIKVSLRSPSILPRLALVDPEMTFTLPPDITAATGMDALTQLIEPYVSNKANPITDAICRGGISRAARSLVRAYDDGTDPLAREDMAIASLFGGLALANAKLGAVHGFAGVLGGMFLAPHGAICARMLPVVMAMNVRALHQRYQDNAYLQRYDEVARMLTGSPGALASDGVAWVRALSERLCIPPLSQYGISVDAFPEIIEKTAKASSTQGNPVQLTPVEMYEILGQSL